MMDAVINLLALGLMGFIIWWFWLSRPALQQVGKNEAIEIVVEHGNYTPSHIEVPQGEAVTLNFIRRDPSPCAEKVLFDELDIALELPLEEAVSLVIEPLAVGEYRFSCQMQMYRGSLIVKGVQGL